MAINPLASYASQQINNPFTARGDEQARINDRDQNRERESTEIRPAGTQAAESQSSESRNNGSLQSRAKDTQEDAPPPRNQARGSVLDITI